MRLTLKLTLALIAGVFLVHALQAWMRVDREASHLLADARQDQRAMGHLLAEAFSEAWDEGGATAAFALLRSPTDTPGAVTVRWVWLESAGSPEHAPMAPRDALIPAMTGREVTWHGIRPDGAEALYTYIPVDVSGEGAGALEVGQSVRAERAFIRTSLYRELGTSAVTAVVAGLVALILGTVLVGRPTRQLIARAEAIGAGEFEGKAGLSQSDELGDVGRALDELAARLAEARLALEQQSHERVQAVEQLRHSERLATLGRVASGIAHELGTPLNVVSARAKMIVTGESEGDEARDSARRIQAQVDRMEAIVRQLLAFARPTGCDRSVRDVTALVEESMELVDDLAEQRQVRMELHGAPVQAEVDATHLGQVVTNLLVNGIHAMPEGGTLRVAVDRTPAHWLGDEDNPVRLHARVQVSDEGTGIPEEALEHLFEPFFTTKEDSRGTGLGLAIASNLARQHDGWIEVESTLGLGSRFTVFLPSADA